MFNIRFLLFVFNLSLLIVVLTGETYLECRGRCLHDATCNYAVCKTESDNITNADEEEEAETVLSNSADKIGIIGSDIVSVSSDDGDGEEEVEEEEPEQVEEEEPEEVIEEADPFEDPIAVEIEDPVVIY